MKDKIKFDFSDRDKVIIINSLNLLRNHLRSQNKDESIVDELLQKLTDKSKVELDIVDSKIIINSLENLRHKLKSQNEPRGDVNDLLLRIINETDKKKVPVRILRKDNGKRRY